MNEKGPKINTNNNSEKVKALDSRRRFPRYCTLKKFWSCIFVKSTFTKKWIFFLLEIHNTFLVTIKVIACHNLDNQNALFLNVFQNVDIGVGHYLKLSMMELLEFPTCFAWLWTHSDGANNDDNEQNVADLYLSRFDKCWLISKHS